jgi:UDP-3-O-[3-hydroxymyristoyl] glucosamine N-acyltransferase
MSFTIAQLSTILGLEYRGEGARLIQKLSSWEMADETSLIFIDSWTRQEIGSDPMRFACAIAPREQSPQEMNVLFSRQPKLDFARAAAYLHPRPKSRGTRHLTAIVAPGAEIGPDVELGPFVVIAEGARIGKGSILHAGVIVGQECILGQGCILYPHVVLYPGIQLGDRVILHAGVVVGSDGFGYVFDGRNQVRFPQLGSVILEDDVEIGSNTTIDRGSLGTTRICAGAKVDNLVQIAHNVEIGHNVVIAAQTGISGSTVIEDNAVIGGQVGFGDHARVQQGVVIGSKAGILPGKIVRSGDVYWGVPVRPLREYKRLNALFGRLPEMKAEIDTLKKKVARLEELTCQPKKET